MGKIPFVIPIRYDRKKESIMQMLAVKAEFQLQFVKTMKGLGLTVDAAPATVEKVEKDTKIDAVLSETFMISPF